MSSKKRQTSHKEPASESVGGNGRAESSEPARTQWAGELFFEPAIAESFEKHDLARIYRLMVTARQLDDKMLRLIRQGKGNFHIGGTGHEAAQVAVGLHIRSGSDWSCAYYRDLAYALTIGFTTRDIMLAHFAKEADVCSGGRQMPEHYSDPEKRAFVPPSAVGAQFLPAVGLAMAASRTSDSEIVYVSSGEGATSQGAFHEAINWSAKDGLPVLFHIEDNGLAISTLRDEQTAGGDIYAFVRGVPNLARMRVDGTDFFAMFGAAEAALEHIRAGNGPICLVSEVVRLLPHSSSDNHLKYRKEEELNADQKRDPISRFEAVTLEAGLLSEDDLAAIREEVKREIDEAADWAYAHPDPDPTDVTVNVLAPGNGADNVPVEPGEEGDPVVLIDAINHALHEEMARDERMVVYGEDVAREKGGVFTATRGLTAAFGEDRCFNSPLAENAIVGTAVGLSAAGFRPVVEIQFGDYIWPAMQQLRNVLPSVRYRSNGAWTAPVVLRVPVGGYIHGGPYHSQNIEAIFAHTPGYRIAIPSTAADAKGLLKAAIRSDDPVLFLEHKALYRQPAARSPEPSESYVLPFGRARVVREGADLTLVTYGAMVYKALNVARELEKQDVSVEIIDLRTIVPLDMDTILQSIQKTNRALVAYEDQRFVGFGAEISAQIMEQAFRDLDAPVGRVGALHTPVPFSVPLESAVLPSDDGLLNAALETIRF